MDGERIEQAIMELCLKRGQGKTICPSEAARRLAEEGGDWRGLMGPVRQAAVRLADDGRISIYRKGRPIASDGMRGVIRLGMPGKTLPGSG